MRRLFVICLLSLLCLSFADSDGLRRHREKKNTIKVTGVASTFVPTSLFVIGFTIETLHMSASKSLTQNKAITTSINSIFTELRIPMTSVTTIAFSIEPKYESEQSETTRAWTQIFKGYAVSNQLEVKLTDLNLLSRFLDRITAVGVNIVKYINFEIDEPTETKLRTQLVSTAVADAKNKAQLLATPLGVTITGVRSVRFTEEEPVEMKTQSSGLAMAAESDAPQIYEDKNREIKVSVDVTFNIANK
jgi:uncharacterized protein YggE